MRENLKTYNFQQNISTFVENKYMHNHINKLFLIIILFIGLSYSKAQQLEEFKERGVIYITTFGFANGFNEIAFAGDRSISNRITTISAHQVVGYQFNPYFSLGMGLGFEKWKRTSFIPLYADLRANLFYKRYSPFINVNFGYSSKWYESPIPENQSKVIQGAIEGLYFAGGIGLKVMFSKSAAGLISIEYKLQESSIKYSDELNDHEELTTNREDRAIYQFVGVKVGVLF